MYTQRFLISALVLAAAALPASSASCTSTLCTGSVSSGSDSTDRTTFNAGNSDLSFSNITFDDATGTYTAAGGLNGSTDLGSGALLYGVSFVGCLSSQSPCGSNSSGVAVGSIIPGGGWDGGTDPVLLVNSSSFGGGNWETITITLPANTYAFGIDLINQNNTNTGAPILIHVDATADKPTVAPVALPGSVFFAFRANSPIGTVSIYPGLASEQLALDNFEIGTLNQQAATPEVATMVTVGGGLFMLLYVRKRKWRPALA